MTLGPMAEAILKSICQDSEVEIASRGLVVLFPGPINPKVEVVLANHGLEASSEIARQLVESDFNRETLVLSMNARERDMFHSRYPLISVATLGDFIGEKDVDDPFGGSLIDYEKCFQNLSVMIRKLKERAEEE